MRSRSSLWILFGVGVLVTLTPFGEGSTHPAVFVAYRAVLLTITLLCWSATADRTGPDLPVGVYLIGFSVLLLLLLSVWASAGQNPNGVVLWFEHLFFALFLAALARFAAGQDVTWRATVLGLVVGAGVVHLALGSTTLESVHNLFGNANYLAAYLLVGFAVAVAGALFSSHMKWRIAAGVAAVILFSGITSTLSRGATLAALAVMTVGILRLGRRKVVIVAGLIALTSAVAIVMSNPGLISKFADRGQVDPYNYQRTAIWMSTGRMIREFPVLGVGLSRYDDVARRFRPPVEDTIARYMKRQAIAHSEYLQYAAEAGLPAGLLLVVLIGVYLSMLWRSAAADRQARVFQGAGLLAAVGVAVHGIVDNVFQIPVVLATLAVLGVASGPLTGSRTPRFPQTHPGRAALAAAVLLLFLVSSAIPAVAYGLNRSAQAYLSDGDIRNAEQAGRMAVAAQAGDAALLLNLGRVYVQEYRRFGDLHLLDMAEAYFHRSAAANPDLIEPRIEYADSLILRLQNGSAGTYLHSQIARANQDVLELDPFLPMVALNLAEAHYHSGRYDEAVSRLRETIAFEPNFVPAYLRLADWYRIEGREAQSAALTSQALAIVERYEAMTALTDYEAMLLGRPAPGGDGECGGQDGIAQTAGSGAGCDEN